MGLYKRKKSPYWWYSFKIKGRPRIHGSTEVPLGEKKAAELVFQKKRLEAVQGKNDLRPSDITVMELLNQYLPLCADQGSYATKCSSIKIMNEKLGIIKVVELTPSDIESFRLWRKRNGAGELTINRDLCTLRHAINKRKRELGIIHNPVEEVRAYPTKKYRRIVVHPADKLNSVLHELKPMIRLFCIFKMSSGMRRGELINLKWTDIDFSRGIIYVEKNKEGNPKVIVIHEDMMKVLNLLSRDTEFVFTYNGEKLKEDGILKTEFNRVRTKLGMKNLRLNDLRHIFATDLTEDADIRAASMALGHSTVKTTEIYVNSHLDYLRRQISKKRSRFPKDLEKSDKHVTPIVSGLEFSRN